MECVLSSESEFFPCDRNTFCFALVYCMNDLHTNSCMNDLHTNSCMKDLDTNSCLKDFTHTAVWWKTFPQAASENFSVKPCRFWQALQTSVELKLVKATSMATVGFLFVFNFEWVIHCLSCITFCQKYHGYVIITCPWWRVKKQQPPKTLTCAWPGIVVLLLDGGAVWICSAQSGNFAQFRHWPAQSGNS